MIELSSGGRRTRIANDPSFENLSAPPPPNRGGMLIDPVGARGCNYIVFNAAAAMIVEMATEQNVFQRTIVVDNVLTLVAWWYVGNVFPGRNVERF